MMIGSKLFQFMFFMAFLLLAACQEQDPVVVTEKSTGTETPAATAAIVPSATATAVLPTLTASPLPPTIPPPTATPSAPPTPAPAPTKTPALTYDCPIEPPAVADDAAAAGAPLRVAFIAEDGIQLWDEAADTRELLFEADDVSSLAFSDDQKLIAFTRENEQFQVSLWVMGAGGENARELLSAADLLALNLSQTKDLAVDPYRLVWIPGTHRLAFSTRTLATGDGLPDVFQELRVIDADSGSLEEIIDHSDGGTFTFSPDGAFFAQASDTSVSLFKSTGELVARDIVVYPALGLSDFYYHPPIIWRDDNQFFTLATINTADGLEVAYNRDVTSTIWRVGVDGRTSELATIPGMTLDHAFSPNLEQVAFMRTSAKGPPLRELHIADVHGAWDVVYREGETLSFGQWNPAGGTYQFIFHDGWGEAGLGRLCHTAEPLPAVSKPGSTRRARWVDATRYLYTALPEGHLYLGSVDGSQKLVGELGADRVSGRTGPLYDTDIYWPDS